MTFLKHIACPFCGSSDANALYKGGSSFCFSCRRSQKGTISPYLLKEDEKQDNLALPDDACSDYPEHVLNWVFKYEVTIDELLRHGVVYSAYRDQLIYVWRDGQGKEEQVVLWQARNFSKEAKQKCYTKGTPNDVLPIYYGGDHAVQCLAIVEDPISAIKAARHCKAVLCVLGSDLPLDKLKRLERVLGPFLGLSRVVVWLDGNMYHKAQRIAERLQMLGVDARAVYTEDDPKECTDETIMEMVEPR
jgi:hypothetical protein